MYPGHYGLTVQPYIIIVGHDYKSSAPVNCYVVIAQTEFKVETSLRALDICFKAFFTLNYKYPVEPEQVWLFIQTFFYDIYTHYDKTYQSVKTDSSSNVKLIRTLLINT